MAGESGKAATAARTDGAAFGCGVVVVAGGGQGGESEERGKQENEEVHCDILVAFVCGGGGLKGRGRGLYSELRHIVSAVRGLSGIDYFWGIGAD